MKQATMATPNVYLGRKQKTFDEAIAVKPHDGSTTIFTANIAWDWCGE